MAYPGVVVLDRDYGHRPGSHAPSTSSPARPRDWRPDEHSMHDSLPHRTRSLSHHAIQLDHLRRRPSVAAVPTAPRHVPSSWSESAPSPFASVTMPVITRSSTAPYRRPDDYQYSRDGAGRQDRTPYAGAYAHVPAPSSHSHSHSHRRDGGGDGGSYPADASYPPGARRVHRRRQVSPLSARHYRSTPDTTRSSRTSVCESDGFSAITADTQDERQKLPPAPELNHDEDEVDEDEDDEEEEDDDERRHVGPKVLQQIRHNSPDRRGMRRITMRRANDSDHLRESSSSEEDKMPGPLVRRWTDHRPPPMPQDARHHSRHSSRHRSELLDSGSSVRAGPPRRSQSAVDEPRQIRTLESRLSRKQRDTEVVYVEIPRPPPVRRSSTTAGPRVNSRSPSSSRRRSSLLGSLVSPKAPERSEKHDKTSKQVQCIICLDDFAKLAKLKCGHRMCSGCLKTVFKRSIKEPQEMPPKCCTQDIPLKFVDPLFSISFKKTWNQKLVEFSTRNRVYCPYKRCGAWIKPDSVYRTDDGRKCAKCGDCKMKVCWSCNGKWHSSRKCPRDEETSRILEQAKEAGWQRCYKCREMVELKEGCNHMTCRCGGQFCMICGSKWKSCECPWFNFETPDDEDDPASHTPSRLERAALERLDSRHASSKGVARGTYESGVVPNAVRQRAMSYDEEMVMRRLQERQDGNASRRRRQKDAEDGHGSNSHQHQHYPHQRRHSEVEVEVEENEERDHDRDDYGRSARAGGRTNLGSAAGRHTSDDYRRGPQHIVMPPSPPPAAAVAAHMPPPVFDAALREPMAGDYLADVGRARGAYRQDSTERRLAERFSEARVSLRERAPEMSGNPMVGSPPSAAAAAAALAPPGAPLQGLGLHMPPGSMTAMHSRMGGPPPMPSMPPMGADIGYGFAPPRLMRAAMSDPSGMVTGREPRREDATRGVRREAPREPRPSMMAGLSGPGSGMNRVHEWRNHVEPGGPQGGSSRC